MRLIDLLVAKAILKISHGCAEQGTGATTVRANFQT